MSLGESMIESIRINWGLYRRVRTEMVFAYLIRGKILMVTKFSVGNKVLRLFFPSTTNKVTLLKKRIGSLCCVTVRENRI